jgi:ribose transport system ATP-binding protein
MPDAAPESGAQLLEVAGLKKYFGATHALDGVDLAVRPGEVHALIGENGAGKSTLLNILSGLLKPGAGSVTFRGAPYRPADPLEARRLGIAHVHQELSLCGHLSVAENIFMGEEPHRGGWMDRRAMNHKTAEILELFPHPALTPQRRVSDLTIAARQIVEVCRALARRASLILMDEPTSSLQRADVERLFQFIRRLGGSGISVIYVSHFLEEVREIADAFTVLRDGCSVLRGSLAQVRDDQLVAAMVGRPVREIIPVRTLAPGAGAASPSRGVLDQPEIVLHVEDLSASPVVLRAGFDLRRGEVLGIAGLIGAGRTELLRALFGLDRATAGTVTVTVTAQSQTLALRGRGPKQRIAAGVGYLSEDRKGEGLAVSLSVADNITLTNLAACSRLGWIDLERQRRLAEDCARTVGVKAQTIDAPVRRLSGGNQQKVALARLLHQGCEIFLLDEPTRGVDVSSKAQIHELIASLARSGKSVIMVSSYLPELFGICHRLAVMRRGQLSPARPIGEWTPETVLQAAIGA